MKLNSCAIATRTQFFQRRGFTVLELMAVTSIVGMLTSLVLPAVQQVRETARRIQCTNNLKQIGFALHNYHDLNACLPSGWQWESTQQSAYGWGVPLLPFLEQTSLYHRVDRNVVLVSQVNDSVRKQSIGIFLCPSDISEPTFALYEEDDEITFTETPLVILPTANYLGVFGTSEPDKGDLASPLHGEGAFIGTRPIRFSEFRRGMSHTFIVGERTMARVPSTWLGVDKQGEDAACRLVGNAVTSPNCDECDECGFDSRHPGCANFLWGDGRVSLVEESIDSRIYQHSANRK